MAEENALSIWVPPTTAAALGRKPLPEDAGYIPGSRGVRRANSQREFGLRHPNAFWNNYRSYLSTLPRPVDDLDRSMGLDVIQRMMQDPQINSSLYLAALACMSRGLRVKPRITDKDDPNYETAIEYQKFIEDNLAGLDSSFTETLLDIIINSLSTGNSVAEMTWELKEGGVYDGKLMMKSVKVKHPEIYSFLVDPYGNIPGLAIYTGKKNGSSVPFVPTVNQKVIVDYQELGDGWTAVPIEKFAILTHRKRFHDPRGQSALRSAYGAWVLLMQLWPEYLKYLTQFASPSIVGTLPEKSFPTRNSLGEIEDPLDVLYDELMNFANGTVLALRYGSVVDLKWSQGDGTAFINAINLLNHQMVKAILHQLLATEEGKHQARAASSTHQDVLNIAVRGLKNGVVSMVQRQVFKPMIKLNFGPEAADTLTPYCSLGDIAPEDKSDMIKAYAVAGWKMGPTQWPAVDAELELEVRSIDQAQDDFDVNNPVPIPVDGAGGPSNKSGNPGEPSGTGSKNKKEKKPLPNSSPKQTGGKKGRDGDKDGLINEKGNRALAESGAGSFIEGAINLRRRLFSSVDDY